MNVILIVSDGYPKHFSANNAKGEFIAKGLQSCGCKVAMVDGVLGHNGTQVMEHGVSSTGIEYYILPRKGGVIQAVVSNQKVINRILREHYVEGDINYVILGIALLPFFGGLVLSAKRFGYKTTALYHEWHYGMSHKNKLFKMEAYFRDQTFGYFLDSILPIGHFLQDKSKPFKKPMMLLPVLGNFERERVGYSGAMQFTYCGHIGYVLRNQMLLNVFIRLKKDITQAKLVLVVLGNKQHFARLHDLLQEKSLLDNVEVKTQLSQEKLYALYDTSLALLLPLDPSNLQDKARFSQKTAEYAASRRPIITSSVGEMPYYFKDKKSAMLAEYSADGYYKAMLYLATHLDDANKIGQAGYEVGKEYFDYLSAGRKLMEFFRATNK